MEENNPTVEFLFHVTWWERMKSLGTEKCMSVMDSIVEYLEKGTLPSLDDDAQALFDEIRDSLDSEE